MVGILGKKALASVSLANSVFFIIIIFGLGISTSISSLIASLDAKHEYKKGAMIFYHGLILNFLLSILMYVFIHVFFYVIPYLGQPQEILSDTISFLRIIALSFIPWMAFEVFEISEGLSLVVPSLIITWISAFINIILNYSFINGFYGFPNLGIKGIAYATLISRITMLIGLYLLLYKYKKVRIYYKYFHCFFKKEYFEKILKIGIPSGLHMLFEMSAFSISSFITGKCGIKELAAHQIVISLVTSTFLLSTGFSVAATVRIGNQLALKNYSELRKIGWSVLFMEMTFMLVCSFFFILFRNHIPYIYIKNDHEVVGIAKKMIIIASIFQLFDGLQGIILGALRGIQDVKIPMWISFFSYWIIALPIAWIFSIYLKMGGKGVWMGLGIGLTISSMLLMIRYETITKRLIKMNDN
ncbi:Multi antimicrobial extrusion protein [Blattabacterium sp. (Blatta orientalis) str. Tarazona]|uniref:MATE family efflux transporter n=1 Tax=Blattabacterium sp. (Blatta orientalis) TaxID=367806 RepID=UPI0002AD5FD2|nr:MATE family efflux transporter [Blattabacterium sp. (Blatta orientalis)]AGD98089.1 Multi antimicrobial extrusion protein [Blattabacterium sp. (Blatta orientalis) str. Tarazona]